MAMRHITAALLGLMLAACTGGPPPPSQVPAPAEYRLDAGDALRVIVFGQEALSGAFKVDDAGVVVMPLLAPLPVRGLTVREAKAAIEEALARDLLRNPSVAVEVATFRPFFILGEVNQPGQYPYVTGMTVETAAAIAGGYTYRANRSTARISRPGAGQELAVSTTTPVIPGDTVFIRERYF